MPDSLTNIPGMKEYTSAFPCQDDGLYQSHGLEQRRAARRFSGVLLEVAYMGSVALSSVPLLPTSISQILR